MKITIDFDTKTKKMIVKQNGIEITNISSIYFYPDYEHAEKAHVEISTFTEDKEEKTRKVTRIMASGKEMENPPHINSQLVASLLGS